MGQLEERQEDGVTIYESEGGEELGADRSVNEEQAEASKSDLQKKNKSELLEMAKAQGIEADDSMTKDRLVTLISDRTASTSQ